jgi:hypothetical protein
VLSKRLKSRTTPPSMLFAPAKGVCPPDLTAKGHAGRFEVASEVNIVMTLATSAVSTGCTMHFGARMEVVDHRWLLAWVYADDLGLRTLRGRLEVSLEH